MNGGIVNRVLLHSAVDGPGNRLVFFLQGCNFACSYCHNPETINVCDNCGNCIQACPTRALTSIEGTIQHNRELCRECGACLSSCSKNSSPLAFLLSLSDVEQLLNDNKKFISGITVSGGEATCQDGFVIDIFKAAKKLNLSTFLDTNGYVSSVVLESIMSYGDKAMVDLKSFDQTVHRKLTGKSNERVLANIEKLSKHGKLYEVRTVVVPDLIDNVANIDAISKWLATLDVDIRYKLIGFRPIGVKGDAAGLNAPSTTLMEKLKAIAEHNRLTQLIIV